MVTNYVKKIFKENANYAIKEDSFFFQYYNYLNFIEQKDEDLYLSILIKNNCLIKILLVTATEKRVQAFKNLYDQVNSKRW